MTRPSPPQNTTRVVSFFPLEAGGLIIPTFRHFADFQRAQNKLQAVGRISSPYYAIESSARRRTSEHSLCKRFCPISLDCLRKFATVSFTLSWQRPGAAVGHRMPWTPTFESLLTWLSSGTWSHPHEIDPAACAADSADRLHTNLRHKGRTHSAPGARTAQRYRGV